VIIHVDSDWWKELFDEIYLLTDARSVCNESLTFREVNFLEGILDLKKSASILDLCGGEGRHALELSRRGFQNVTVLDYSGYLIKRGEKRAETEKLKTVFIQADARYTGLPAQGFQFVIVMASSFGYFPHENENKKILIEAFRLLKTGGTLLLDLPDKDYILQNFKPVSSHKINEDITVSRTRELGDDIIYSNEKVTSKKNGCLRDRTYCVRLYSREKISDLICSVGFTNVTCKKDFMSRKSQGDYGFMTNRMVVSGEKK
jgi:D-alanine-D-alanine ligase